mgnify:CR=1 FL=1
MVLFCMLLGCCVCCVGVGFSLLLFIQILELLIPPVVMLWQDSVVAGLDIRAFVAVFVVWWLPSCIFSAAGNRHTGQGRHTSTQA